MRHRLALTAHTAMMSAIRGTLRGMNLSSQHRCHEALRHAGYGELCAWTLARAMRVPAMASPSPPISAAYADQNAAVTGRVIAEMGT